MSQHPDPLAELPPEELDVGMGAADPHPDLDDDLVIDEFDDDETPLDPPSAPHLDADAAVTPPRQSAIGGGGGGSW